MINKFFYITALVAGLALTPLIAGASLDNSLTHINATDVTYNMTLDNSKVLSTATTPNKREKIGTLKTDLQNDIIFNYTGLSALKGGFQTIANGGYITNYTPIDSITDLTFKSDGDLVVTYGWFIDANEEIHEHDVENTVRANGKIHFTSAPSFFTVTNKSGESVNINSITITYACKRVYAPFESKVDFNYYAKAVKENKASKIITNMSYSIAELGIKMKYNSTYILDSKNTKLSKFDYSYDKLNGLDAEELMTTINGTYYTNNDNLYEIKDGVLKQVGSLDPNVKTTSINLDQNLISNYTINRDTTTLTVNVKEGSEMAFLNTDKPVKNIISAIDLGEDRNVGTITTTYVSDFLVGNKTYKANVSIVATYSYLQETVVIPNA